MKPSNRSRVALALLLLALAGLMPESSPAVARSAPHAIGTAAASPETEPNNTYQNATFIQLDQISSTPKILQKTMLGTIDSAPANDNKGLRGDWYRFVALQSGGSVTISLT